MILQYGFAFGITYLSGVISSPILAKIGTWIGPKPVYIFGAFGQSLCITAFGFITLVDDTKIFIVLSYILRYPSHSIISKVANQCINIFRALIGITDVACVNAVLSILLELFPQKYASIMSWTKVAFSVGFIIGNFQTLKTFLKFS